jgi:hypothetical protein
MSTKNNFVVYAYSDENWVFYYIGKGRPRRPYSRSRYIKRPKDSDHIHILEKDLDEKTAYEHEKLLISLYGRKELDPVNGTLLNSTNGGGGTSGYKWSKGNLEKISGSNHHKSISRNWCHEIYGFVPNKTSSELCSMFPEQNMKSFSLNSLANGNFKSYKGWVFVSDGEINQDSQHFKPEEKFSCEYAKQKIKEARENSSLSKISRNNPGYLPRNWCHLKHGLVLNRSCTEIEKLFPDTKASVSGLNKTAMGKQKHHRGWILIDSDLLDNSLSPEELQKIFTPEYAEAKINQYERDKLKNRAKFVGESNYMSGKKGELHPSFGSRRSRESRKRISTATRSRFNGKDWFHPKYGVVKNVLCCELVEMFPEQKLSNSNLSSVSCGARKQHKGWTCLDVTH